MLPDEVLYAAVGGLLLIFIFNMLPAKKRFPPPPKPWAAFDKNGVLWNRESSGLQTGKPQDKLSAFPDATNAYDIMAAAVVKGGDKLTAGKRKLIQRHWVDLNGKQVEKLVLADEYEWMTYKKFGEVMHQVGCGFVSWAKCKPNDCVIIYAETAREWMLAAQGAFTQGITVVTVYATLGEDGFLHGAKQTRAKCVVADAKLLKILANVFKDKANAPYLKELKKVVYIADAPSVPDKKMEADVKAAIKTITSAGVEVKTLDELITAGTAKPSPPSPPKPSDLAIIMYTSGTTGMPKGVKISHANVVATVAGLEKKVPSLFPGGSDDLSNQTYLAYMPLAHIMEMAGELMAFTMNITIGYGSPHTLTPTGVKVMPDTCKGDAQVCQPTLLVMAPAILDKVFVGLQLKMKSASPVVQKLFAKGLEAGVARYDAGGIGAPFFYNKIVFKKVQALLGGKLQAVITGSAPLAPGIQKFAQTVFNCPVRQGYGLTETCASSCIGEPCDNTCGQVGTPTVCTCIKLRDWAEGGYKLADADDPEIGMPRGEILVGGSMVCQGYLVDPSDPDPDVVAKNKSEFVTENGIRYFCSGDIGQVTPEGTLMIIDRKKDLVKLQQGEYVALSKVEGVLKLCPLVEYPMCYAESTKDYCVALVCPNHGMLKKLASDMGIAETDVDKLCDNKEVVMEVSKQCAAACKKGKLVGFEIPRRIALVADTFTPENDCLTAAMKLKRNVAAKIHEKRIKSIYS